jgi:hypothetical protein
MMNEIVDVTGVEATGSIGDVTIDENEIIDAVGVEATGGVGSVHINSNVENASGVEATASLDSVAVFNDIGFNLNTNQTATIEYFIAPGYVIDNEGYGWGAGVWGGGTSVGWGQGATTPIILPQRDWWFDNFDSDLVMNIRNGPIYYWTYDDTFNSSAVLLSTMPGATNVPDEAMQILVSQNDKHLLAFGATPFGGGAFDPLLIRWADQDNPFNWTPTPTNSAGFLRVSRGSRIVRALPTRQEILVWTDSHLYSLQFLGTTDVFGLQEYADNISIISPRACASANNITYWMGRDKFYAYTGRIENLPCTVRTYVFTDINFSQVSQIICGTNEEFQEIWWFYPSQNSFVNDRYVIYNYQEKIWYFGSLNRTAWLDVPTREFPQAVNFIFTSNQDGTGILYNHEDGIDADTEAISSYIQSSDFDLADGDKFILTKRIIPDIGFERSTANNPTVLMAVRPRNFPGSRYQNDPSDSQNVIETDVDVYTDQIFIRARARQMALKVQSEQLGVQWQLGDPRLDGREDGKR